MAAAGRAALARGDRALARHRCCRGAVLLPAVALRLDAVMANYRRFVEAGARLVAATDAGLAPAKPHDVVRQAPARLRQFGLGQAAALRTITSVAAHACGLGQRKGRLAAGYDADILAVDGDPLADPDACVCRRCTAGRRCGCVLTWWPSCPGLPGAAHEVPPTVRCDLAPSHPGRHCSLGRECVMITLTGSPGLMWRRRT